MLKSDWICCNLCISYRSFIILIEFILNTAKVIPWIALLRVFPILGMLAVFIKLGVIEHKIGVIDTRILTYASIPCAIHMKPVSVILY